MAITDREIFEAIKTAHGGHAAQAFMWQMKEWKGYRVELRDHFAKDSLDTAYAMALAEQRHWYDGEVDAARSVGIRDIANRAYALADAMLEARKPKEGA